MSLYDELLAANFIHILGELKILTVENCNINLKLKIFNNYLDKQ